MGVATVKGSTYPQAVQAAPANREPPKRSEPTADQKAEKAASQPKPPEVINLQGQATGRLLNTTA